MARKRRRTLSRDPFQRFKMWDAKLKPEIVAQYLEATKSLVRDKVLEYQVTHEWLIQLVRGVLARYGKDFQIMQEYMWYAEKLWRLINTYKGKALQYEADALYMYYRIRGRDDTILRDIAKALGITLSSVETILARTGITVGVVEVPAGVISVKTYAYESPIVTVTNTSNQLKAEATTDKQYLDPENIKVYVDNPNGSGVTLYIELSLLYDDDSETIFRTITVSEGVTDTYSILSEDIYEDIVDGKLIKAIRLYAYVSATPASDKEPSVQLKVYGREFG